jgi:ABC-type transport system involved in cytochrome c biogenesis ATPase subunit
MLHLMIGHQKVIKVVRWYAEKLKFFNEDVLWE